MSEASKVWFVTGSSRGLGRALVSHLLAQGQRVVATARRPEQLADLKADYGERVLTLPLDVRESAQARTAVSAAVDVFGGIDVLVNNAGYGHIAALEDSSEEDFRDQIETNLMGVIHVTRAVLPVMRKQGAGRILQISSVGGRTATPGLSAYQTAKWGVGGFSEVMARELKHLGIQVTVVEPGGMPTDWAGASMQITPPQPDYEASVGPMIDLTGRLNAHFAEGGKRFGSDLGKVAAVLMRLAAEPEAPLRLLIGSDAYQIALQAEDLRREEALRWESVSRSTDAGEVDLDMLAEITRIKH